MVSTREAGVREFAEWCFLAAVLVGLAVLAVSAASSMPEIARWLRVLGLGDALGVAG